MGTQNFSINKITRKVLCCFFVIHTIVLSTITYSFAAKSIKLVKDSVLVIAPKINNPRNSEGAFITLKSGRICFIYSHYTGASSSDHASAYLASRFSDDNGKTWSQTDKLEVAQEGKMNVMSVSLLRLTNGQIALFYLRKNSNDDCMPMLRFSNNEGANWTEPISCITDQQGYFVLNNDRVIQLKNGRLIFAVALHQQKGSSVWSNTGRLFSYYSDDNGKVWKQGLEIPNLTGVVTQEPGIIELKTGKLWMFIRTNTGVQYQSFSNDKGASWSAIEPTNIVSPLSPASIKRIPSTGDLLLVWNNNDGTDLLMKGKRTPLTIAISKDDGQHWDKLKVLENNPDGWFCYTAITFVEKHVLMAYCAGSQINKTHLSKTQISKIAISDIYQ